MYFVRYVRMYMQPRLFLKQFVSWYRFFVMIFRLSLNIPFKVVALVTVVNSLLFDQIRDIGTISLKQKYSVIEDIGKICQSFLSH